MGHLEVHTVSLLDEGGVAVPAGMQFLAGTGVRLRGLHRVDEENGGYLVTCGDELLLATS